MQQGLSAPLRPADAFRVDVNNLALLHFMPEPRLSGSDGQAPIERDKRRAGRGLSVEDR